MGRHAAPPHAVTEPMKVVTRPAQVAPETTPMRAVNPPINPEPETVTMTAITADDIAEFERVRKATTDPDEWMEPLRHGGARFEARMRQTFRERGLILAKRVGRRALRLRAALAKGGRR